MSDIVVYNQQQEENLIEAARIGLMSELREKSVPCYAQTIDAFMDYIAQADYSLWGGQLPVAFASYLKNLTEQGRSANTVKAHRSRLSRFFEWLLRTRYITADVYADLRSVKVPKSQGRKAGNWLTQEMMQQMLDAASISTPAGRRDRAMFAILMGCALRRSELTNLKWKDLVQVGGTWVFINMQRKHGRTQAYIPVPAWVKKAIDQYSPRGNDEDAIIVSIDKWGNRGEQMEESGIYRIVRDYAERLGFGRVGVHDLRRSSARNYKEKGAELGQIQQLLGHSSVVVTERYINEVMDIQGLSQTVEMEV